MTQEERSYKILQLQKELSCVEGKKCEIYSRIVGYHRPVENWNEGKQEEFRNRITF